MRKLYITLSLIASVVALRAQQADSAKAVNPVNHEVGFNATMLLKQVFNISNNTLPMLPYDITYKRIRGTHALRIGGGLEFTTQSVAQTGTLLGSSTPRPEDNVKTYNNTFGTDLRGGFEWRFAAERRVLMYVGVDLVGGYSLISSQSQTANQNTFNGDYFYNRVTSAVNLINAGAGPVVGLQVGLSKRLGLFTEIPVYFVYYQETDRTDTYARSIVNGVSNYTITITEEFESSTTRGFKTNVSLPVTFYLTYRIGKMPTNKFK